MESYASRPGRIAPASQKVEQVVRTVTTSTTHGPAHSAPHGAPSAIETSGTGGHDIVMREGEAERRSSTGDYALLHLAPAQTTTVVTTTTTTTTRFAPIRVPKSRPIRAARSSFAAPFDTEASEQRDGPWSPEATRADRRSQAVVPQDSDSPLPLDPRIYPLSQARWPEGYKRWNMQLGDMRATFFDEASEAPVELPHASSSRSQPSHDHQGGDTTTHGRPAAGLAAIRELSPLSRPDSGDEQAHTRHRGPRLSTPFEGSRTVEQADRRPSEQSLLRQPSPGPPRKRLRADSPPSVPLNTLSPQNTRRPSLPQVPAVGNYPGASAGLPSPNQSPPSPAFTSAGDDEVEPKEQDTTDLAVAESHAQEFDFGSGIALSGLLSMPDLVNKFTSMPEAMQSYLLFQLLRRSSVPVLQMINQVVEPALRRDFLTELPPELAPLILGHLEVRDLCRSTLVCKTWRRMIDGDWRVWKRKLVANDMWVGDGSDEREAREAITGKKENLFQRRWEAGVWDKRRRSSWNGRDDQVSLYSSHLPEPRQPSTPYRLASPSSSRSASPDLSTRYFVHPFKLLYRRRTLIRRNWNTGTPNRLVFDSGVPAVPPAAQGGNAQQQPHQHVVTCIQFDHEKLISASDDSVLNVYDMRTGQRRASLTNEGGVWAMQLLGDYLVTGSTDKSVRLWNLKTGRCSHIFVGHRSTVRCLQVVEPVNINPDPTGEPIWEPAFPLIVTGSRDWSLRVWKLPMPDRDPDYKGPRVDPDSTEPIDVGSNPYHLLHLPGHESAVRALSAHGRTLCSGSYDMTVRVWDTITGRCRHILKGHTQKVYSVVYDPIRQQCASGSMDFTLRLWDTETGECRAKLEGHTSLVGLLGLSHRNLVSAAADFTLRVWDPDTGECRHTLQAHQGAITCFVHDEHKVISGSDGTVKLWDIRTGAFVRDLVAELTGVWQVAADERFAVAAVSRNGRSEYEVIDFGSVDLVPPEASSPSIKAEESDDGHRFLAAARLVEQQRGRRNAGRRQSDQSTPTQQPEQAPPAPRLPASAFSVRRDSSDLVGSSGTPSRSSSATRAVRRVNNSRDLHAQASTSAMTLDDDASRALEDDPSADTAMDDVQVKTEDVD